jgi:hypothetical protein
MMPDPEGQEIEDLKQRVGELEARLRALEKTQAIEKINVKI